MKIFDELIGRAAEKIMSKHNTSVYYDFCGDHVGLTLGRGAIEVGGKFYADDIDRMIETLTEMKKRFK